MRTPRRNRRILVRRKILGENVFSETFAYPYRCMTRMSRFFNPMRIALGFTRVRFFVMPLYVAYIFVTLLSVHDSFVTHQCVHDKMACTSTRMTVTRLSLQFAVWGRGAAWLGWRQWPPASESHSQSAL